MKRFIRDHWLVIFYLSVYFVLLSLVVLNRFWQYEALYFDHGIYDQALWKVAHFQKPIVDLIDYYQNGLTNQLGNHFTPTMYLLTPLYWVTSRYEPILLVQNLIIVLSGFILWLIAKQKKIHKLLAWAILIAFTWFIGLQNLAISNFHADSLAILALALVFLFFEQKRWKLYWLFLLLTLGAKENFASIGVGMGIFLVFSGWRRQGLLTILFSIFYYFVAVNFLMPMIGGEKNIFLPVFPGLWESAKQLFIPEIKTRTILVSFGSFGFLPLAPISFLPTIFQDFVTRFVLNPGSARWDLGLHYNATLSIILAYGSVLGVSFLQKFKFYQKLLPFHAMGIITIVFSLHRFVYHGPLGLAVNPDFYRHTPRMAFVTNFLDHIPKEGSVMTNNNLAAYLTHTHTVFLPRGNFSDLLPDIIALDLRPGQNPVNFWPANEEAMRKMGEGLKTNPSYRLIFQNGDQVIFVRSDGLINQISK